MGIDKDGDGTGEPVMTFKKPNVGGTFPIMTPPDSDEFNGNSLGLQWQWHANPKAEWEFPFPTRGVLRMNSVQLPENFKNLWDLPNLLLQKTPADGFTATAKVKITPRFDGERFGVVVMGIDHSSIVITNKGGKLYVSRSTATNADKREVTVESDERPLSSNDISLRVRFAPGAIASFSYSSDGRTFTPIGEAFKAREGRWIGAKVGFFFTRPGKFNDAGTVDIDWFRIEK